MGKIFLFFCIFCFAVNVQIVAQGSVQEETGNCSFDIGLNDIAYFSKDNLLAVGGTIEESSVISSIFSSNDGGKTWTKRFEAENSFLSEIHVFDERHGLVVGSENGNALLLRTKDGGITWEKNLLKVKDGIDNIDFVGSAGWAITGEGIFLETTDYGANWKVSQTNIKEPRVINFRDKLNGYILTKIELYNGDIFRTDDGGKKWISEKDRFLRLLGKFKPNEIEFIKLKFTNSETGYLVAQFSRVTGSEEKGDRKVVYLGGVVFTTSTGGKTWQPHVFTTKLGVSKAFIGDGGKIWAFPYEASRESMFFVSSDRGTKWRRISTKPHDDYGKYEVYFFDDNNGLMVVQPQMFYDCTFRTVNGGKTWK